MKTKSAQLIGLIPELVTIDVQKTDRDTLEIVTPDPGKPWVRELRSRVRASLNRLGLSHGFVVSFDRPIHAGAWHDLAIIAGCLGELGHSVPDALYLGALNFQGDVMPIRGVLPILRRLEGVRHAIVAHGNMKEAEHAPLGVVCEHVKHASDVADPSSLSRGFVDRNPWRADDPFADYSPTRGLSDRTVADLQTAIASNKNVLLIGENCHAAARAFHALLPPISYAEALETSEVFSITGLSSAVLSGRPFRAPHHTIECQGLVGGGDPIRPGEVSLAHNGTLYLDDVLDFKRSGLEMLGAALRAGEARIVRATKSATFPAKARVVAAIRPGNLRFFKPERVECLGEYVRIEV